MTSVAVEPVLHDLQRDLCGILRASPTLMRVLDLARSAALPHWRIVSGAVYQTVWNARTGRPPDHGIKDYDLFYCDTGDLSYAAEDREIRRVAALAPPDLAPRIEVRNQARVHLWFAERFGGDYAYPPLATTEEALDHFVATTHAVAVRLEADGRLDIVAPFGLDDAFALRLRPNPRRPLSPAFLAGDWARAVATARARWPEAMIVLPD